MTTEAERDFGAEVDAFDDGRQCSDGSEWRIRAAGLDGYVLELVDKFGGVQRINMTDTQAEELLPLMMDAVG